MNQCTIPIKKMKRLRPITKWEGIEQSPIYDSWIPEIGRNIVKTMKEQDISLL